MSHEADDAFEALLACAECKLEGRDGNLRRRTWPAASGATQCDKLGHGALRRVVGRRYLLLGPIAGGAGGWGTVHEALDLKLDRRCAIKLMRPGIDVHPELVERFRCEALTLARAPIRLKDRSFRSLADRGSTWWG